MKTLLIVAHGSRREASNQEVRALARRVEGLAGLSFDRVAIGFLELAEPSVPAALEACIAQGASAVTIFPYFLAAGRHVTSDIPVAIAPIRQRHPGVRIDVLAHLGAAAGLPELIGHAADAAEETPAASRVSG